MQAQHAQALQAQLDQLSTEVAAQRLALAAATSERDGARASAIEANERVCVSCLCMPASCLIRQWCWLYVMTVPKVYPDSE